MDEIQKLKARAWVAEEMLKVILYAMTRTGVRAEPLLEQIEHRRSSVNTWGAFGALLRQPSEHGDPDEAKRMLDEIEREVKRAAEDEKARGAG
jgi:hypothetical protein